MTRRPRRNPAPLALHAASLRLDDALRELLDAAVAVYGAAKAEALAAERAEHTRERAQTAPEPELVTVADAAWILSVGRTTVFNLCREGKLPAKKIGRSLRFRRSDLEMLAAS